MWPSGVTLAWKKRFITEGLPCIQYRHVNAHLHILNACRPEQEKGNKVPVTHAHAQSKVQAFRKVKYLIQSSLGIPLQRA